jgi:hypothetical protein
VATFAITHRQVTDNYHGRSDPGGDRHWHRVSQSPLAGLGATLNGTYTVVDVPIFLFLGVDEAGDFIFDPDEIITNQLMMAEDSRRHCAWACNRHPDLHHSRNVDCVGRRHRVAGRGISNGQRHGIHHNVRVSG